MKKQVIFILVAVVSALGFYIWNEQKKKKDSETKRKKEEEEKIKAANKLVTPQGQATLGATYGSDDIGGSGISPAVPLTPPGPAQNIIPIFQTDDKVFDSIADKKLQDSARLAQEENARIEAAKIEADNKRKIEEAAALAAIEAENLRKKQEAEAKAEKERIEALAKAEAEKARLLAEEEAVRLATEENLRKQEEERKRIELANSKKVFVSPIAAMKDAQEGRTLAGKGIGILTAPLTIHNNNPVTKLADNLWSGQKKDGSEKTVAGKVIGKAVSAPIKIATAPVKALSKLFGKR